MFSFYCWLQCLGVHLDPITNERMTSSLNTNRAAYQTDPYECRYVQYLWKYFTYFLQRGANVLCVDICQS